METCSVVKSFDVIGGSANCLLMRFVNGVINLFDFETFEEAFHGRVVIAVSLSAHALQESLMCEAFSKRLAGVLGTSVAVDDQAVLWLSEGNCLVERGQREVGIDVLAGCPADNFSRAEVLNGAEVTDLPGYGKESEVGEPYLIRTFGGKTLLQAIGSDGKGMPGIGGSNTKFPFVSSAKIVLIHQFGDGIA